MSDLEVPGPTTTDPDEVEPTAVDPDVVEPTAVDGGPTRGGIGRAVVVTVLAALLVLAILVAAWNVTRYYGSSPTPWLAVLIWALLPALAIAGAANLGVKALGGRPPHFWFLTVLALVLVVAAQTTTITLAARAHENDLARAASACTPAVVTELRGLSAFRAEVGTPISGRDGTCSMILSFPADQASALGRVQQSLETAGWTLAAHDSERLSFTRGTTTVTVAPSGSGRGGTEVVVVLLPA